MRTRSAPAAFFAALALAAGQASAGFIPNVTVTPTGGHYSWNYHVVVTSDLVVSKGDFFTIYDFNGLLPTPDGITMPKGWVATSQAVGLTAPFTAPPDDPKLPNYTFIYQGDTPLEGRTELGDFVLLSKYGAKADSYFSSYLTRADPSDPLVPKERAVTRTKVAVPGTPPPGDTPPPDSPEPGTLILAGAGLAPLAARLWRRRR
jgi:hypothetical protein